MKINKLLYALCVAPLLLTAVRAQDSLTAVILSPRLGESISAASRQRFGLFRAVDGFEKATVYLLNRSTFVVSIESVSPAGISSQHLVPYGPGIIFMMAEKVNHYEELEAGSYQMGSDPAVLQTRGGEKIGIGDIGRVARTENGPSESRAQQATASDFIHFAPSVGTPSPAESYSLGIGCGVSSFNPDLGGITSLLRSIESKFADQGYSIHTEDSPPSLTTLVWFDLHVPITSSWSGRLEVGKSTDGDNADCEVVALSVIYTFDIDSRVVSPYIGVGPVNCRFSLHQTLRYGDRISPVDSVGGYDLLDNLNLGGSASHAGIVWSAGALLYASQQKQFIVDASIKFIQLPLFQLHSPTGETADLRLGGATFGVTLRLGL